MNKDKTKIEINDWVIQEDGLFRGKVVGRGKLKKIEVYKIDIGGDRITTCPIDQVKLWFKAE